LASTASVLGQGEKERLQFDIVHIQIYIFSFFPSFTGPTEP